MNKVVAVMLLWVLFGCEAPRMSCEERDISKWVVGAVEYATPIRSCGKLVGYEVNIPTSKRVQWFMANDQRHDVNGPVQISADIDPGDETVQRIARLSRGPATYDETHGGASVTVTAGTNTLAGDILREFVIDVPVGSGYSGQIRNLKW